MDPSATEKHRVTPERDKTRSASLDKAEFEALYRQSRSALWCIAAAALDRTQAEDIVQDAALIAYERRDSFTPGTNFLAWTARIVRNVALNARRRKREQSLSMIDAAENTSACRNGSSSDSGRMPLTDRGELKPEQDVFDDRVLAALKQLAPEARACLLMRTVLELSYDDIAAALEIPQGTAMSHVHRSRKLLRSSVLKDDENIQPRSLRKS